MFKSKVVKLCVHNENANTVTYISISASIPHPRCSLGVLVKVKHCNTDVWHDSGIWFVFFQRLAYVQICIRKYSSIMDSLWHPGL